MTSKSSIFISMILANIYITNTAPVTTERTTDHTTEGSTTSPVTTDGTTVLTTEMSTTAPATTDLTTVLTTKMSTTAPATTDRTTFLTTERQTAPATTDRTTERSTTAFATTDRTTERSTTALATTDRTVRSTTAPVTTERTTERSTTPVTTDRTTERSTTAPITTYRTTVRSTTAPVTIERITERSTTSPVITGYTTKRPTTKPETADRTTERSATTTTTTTTPVTTADQPTTVAMCNKYTDFICHFNITRPDTNADQMVRDAYNASFLKLNVSVKCSKTEESCKHSCAVECDIKTNSGFCESAMLIALVNGITLTSTNNVDFMTISIDEHDSKSEDTKEKLKIMTIIVGCLAFLVVLLFVFAVMCISKKRNRRAKGGKTKTKRMAKMTLRHTVRTFFSWKEDRANTTPEDGNLYTETNCEANNATYAEVNKVEDIELGESIEEGKITETLKKGIESKDEVKESEENENLPEPIERPPETIRPKANNPYTDLNDICNDPIYANQIAEDMRIKTKS